jgi:hypothetical protein
MSNPTYIKDIVYVSGRESTAHGDEDAAIGAERT